MRAGCVFLVCIVIVGACGDDVPGGPDGGGPPDAACVAAPDAFVPADAADGDAAAAIVPTGEEYDDPSDFILVDCQPGALAGFDPTGVWHADGEADYGGFPYPIGQVHRVDDGSCGRSGRIYGEPSELIADDDGVFIRWTGDWGYGTVVFSFYGCRVDADGSLWGHAAQCDAFFGDPMFGGTGNPCVVGTMSAFRVLRAEPDEAAGLSLLGEHAGDPAWPDRYHAITTNVRVVDGIAYVSRLADGLRIVDVSSPASMQDLGWFEGNFNDVKIVDRADGVRFALAAGSAGTARGIIVIDVSNPASPIQAATFSVLGRSSHTLFVETVGAQTRAYVVPNFGDDIGVFDVTDPANPVELAIHEAATGITVPHDLYVENSIVYLNDFFFGLRIIDTTDPANIIDVGGVEDWAAAGHSSWGTTLGGCKHLIAGGEGWNTRAGVIGVDPACPESYLQLVGDLALRPYVSVHNVMAFDDRAYITWYQDGLRVLDLSDPSAPTVAAWFNTWDPAHPFAGYGFYDGAIGLDVDLAANRIYLADTLRGLLVLQASP